MGFPDLSPTATLIPLLREHGCALLRGPSSGVHIMLLSTAEGAHGRLCAGRTGVRKFSIVGSTVGICRSSTAAPSPPPDEPLPSDAVGAVLVQLRSMLDTVMDAPVWSLDDNRMPNLAYDVLRTALEAIASPRRNQRAGTGPATAAEPPMIRPGILATADTDLTQLTYGQRMGQAFCELLEHLPTDELPHHGAGNATIVVTIDNDQLRTGLGEATLTTGTTVSASQTRRLACNAGLPPLVLGADSAILDLGRTRRSRPAPGSPVIRGRSAHAASVSDRCRTAVIQWPHERAPHRRPRRPDRPHHRGPRPQGVTVAVLPRRPTGVEGPGRRV